LSNAKYSGIDIDQRTDIISFKRFNYAYPVVSINTIIRISVYKPKNFFVIITLSVQICRQMWFELAIVITIWYQAVIGRYYHRFSGIDLLFIYNSFVLF